MKTGDIVKIIVRGELYSTYTSWLERYAPNRLEDWVYGGRPEDPNEDFRLIRIEEDICLIEDSNGKCFIYGIRGIKLASEVESANERVYESIFVPYTVNSSMSYDWATRAIVDEINSSSSDEMLDLFW